MSLDGLDLERAWVIECWRCSNTAESFESTISDAKKDFDRHGWTYDDGNQLCPQCNGVGQ
jgi:hypothetical protein